MCHEVIPISFRYCYPLTRMRVLSSMWTMVKPASHFFLFVFWQGWLWFCLCLDLGQCCTVEKCWWVCARPLRTAWPQPPPLPLHCMDTLVSTCVSWTQPAFFSWKQCNTALNKHHCTTSLHCALYSGSWLHSAVRCSMLWMSRVNHFLGSEFNNLMNAVQWSPSYVTTPSAWLRQSHKTSGLSSGGYLY